jgi:hypothetical protein
MKGVYGWRERRIRLIIILAAFAAFFCVAYFSPPFEGFYWVGLPALFVLAMIWNWLVWRAHPARRVIQLMHQRKLDEASALGLALVDQWADDMSIRLISAIALYKAGGIEEARTMFQSISPKELNFTDRQTYDSWKAVLFDLSPPIELIQVKRRNRVAVSLVLGLIATWCCIPVALHAIDHPARIYVSSLVAGCGWLLALLISAFGLAMLIYQKMEARLRKAGRPHPGLVFLAVALNLVQWGFVLLALIMWRLSQL